MEKSILEKNIEQIQKYNADLAQKILDHAELTNSFEFIESKTNDVVLTYNNTPLHDSIDPQEEALQIFKKLRSDSKSTIHIIFGLGIGYLFKRFSQSCKGKIIVYEPNLDILRIIFEVVDLSEDLAKNSIAIANKKEDIQKYFERFYFADSEITVSYLNSYTRLFPEILQDLVEEASFLKGLFASNYSNLFMKSEAWTMSAVKNIPYILKNNEVESLRNKFSDKPAVIISAGPSLDKNIQFLKEYQDKVIIFCVGTALKAVLKNGIKPDFLVIVEHNDVSTQTLGIDLSEINLILHPMTHQNIFKIDTKRKLNFYPNNDFTTKWLAKIIDIPLTDYINKGTVSICGLFSGKIMGCNPIILMGQDLAYSNGKCYANDSIYNELTCQKDEKTGRFQVKPIDIERYAKVLNKDNDNKHHVELTKQYIQSRFTEVTQNLYFVKGQNGEMMPTDPGYATFIKYFENIATEYGSQVKLINSSEGGAYIEGFEHLPLKSVLEKYAETTINKESIIENSMKSSETTYKNKIQNVITEIDKTIQQLKSSFSHFEEGQSALQKIEKEFKLSRLESKSLKKNFEIVVNSFFAIDHQALQQNIILFGLIYEEYSKLSHFIGNSDNNLDLKKIRKFLDLSSIFFTKGYDKFKNNLIVIQKMREKLDESSNPKS